MMRASLNTKALHPAFKLNGISYSFDNLQEVAYSLIKEGEAHERHIGDFLTDWLDDKCEIEVKTSGSTGTPKAIRLKKQFMVNSARATGDFFMLKASDTALLCLPAEYIAGKMMLVRAMVLGLELDYVAPSTNPMTLIQKEVDFCAMVPLQLQNSLHAIDRIRKLIIGGSPMSAELKDQVQSKTTRIYETYGMTETITHVAVRAIVPREINQSHKMEMETSEIGFKALPDVTFSQDERDCLIINAPKIVEEPVRTNDIVSLISKHEFEWLGRYDNVINSGGVKLFPEQIEAKLSAFISVPFFVAGLPDKKLGQQLVLIIEDEVDSTDINAILWENSVLEKFEIPKKIFQLPAFIRTENGKIRRAETLELLRS